jgi:hypothetical protein
MSDPENFLARWSRRKREIEQLEADKPKETVAVPVPDYDPTLPQDAAAASTDSAAAAVPESESFDPASLPPLDSITAETDIRGYFARGVPAELARAALRRVWTIDPTIRDFVGLAENAWDFNAPETIPGFGPITASDDVAGMMRQMMGEPRQLAAQTGPEPSRVAAPQVSEVSEHLPTRQEAGFDPEGSANLENLPPPNREQAEPPVSSDDEKPAVPMSPERAEATDSSLEGPIRLRGHGGALPK